MRQVDHWRGKVRKAQQSGEERGEEPGAREGSRPRVGFRYANLRAVGLNSSCLLVGKEYIMTGLLGGAFGVW
jgi:hypothetical protein